ncbi:small nuclear ribonucleoprotein [Candidatus Woesearchaeota archaeon]|nr:small nuclear ribonucleoprotein [Candidatus Woesearchaeota archaeon]
MVDLKNNRQYVGKLKSFDIHINVVLEDAEEHVDGQVKRKLGVIFLRGDTITIISPE